ncbi:hypothetical protein [Novosphingobium mangrovi (ex Huang et al. 2023)]|uniref:Phage shock protein B n=1 Tax=Novosphingobium mangrovi (ex Huang et al. 2023) TaxID=2976432 RepID=A0ABT2I233_9SPHN|nr:hypothetical protein [Novosphingobium mangrovi (ex Huang et al. 2023)]MCT2398856.1 hypothetical protein [Novosphingobium mangrovi (ex Huang et al. 2023)]
MSFWTAVVVIFAIACFTWLRTHKYRALGKHQGNYDHTAREHELEREVEEMRKRIAVLERIATDEQRGKDLAREIESLRD